MAGRKSTASMELAIGATIIAGVIILIVMLMAWGNSTSFLGKHYRVVVTMTNVGGLKDGAPVKMGGFQIGRVASIQLKSGSTDMEIVLDIDENILLPKKSTAKVSTAGLVGDAFMEIVPSKSKDTIEKKTLVADAEHLESSPVPDMSDLLNKVNAIGEQVTLLATNLNDVLGDPQFRQALKNMAVNMDAVSHQANLILQRGKKVVDNIELTSQNAAKLSVTIKDSVEKVTSDIEAVTRSATEIADSAKSAIARADVVIDNLDGGITDIRKAVNNTIGNPEVAENLNKTVGNVQTVTGTLAKRNDAIDELITNLNSLSSDIKDIAAHTKLVIGDIKPSLIPTAIDTLNTAIATVTEVVDKIKDEPVLALSINKASDRIVKMKFDEMGKAGYRTSDQVLEEINRWVRENMKQGYFTDPAYPYEARPYVMPGAATAPVPATVQRPYLMEN